MKPRCVEGLGEDPANWKTNARRPNARPTNGCSVSSRRIKDAIMLASTVVLICISLYHASTLRAVTQQRTLRTKVLSRSYLNRAAEGTGMTYLSSPQLMHITMHDTGSGKVLPNGGLQLVNEITFDTQQAKVLRAMDQRIALGGQGERPTKFTTTTTTTTTTSMTDARDAARTEAARAADAARADAAAARADGNAAAAAAAASKAAVSDADPSAGAAAGGLVTSAFAGLITEANPGQTFSGTKGMTALPATTKPKTTTATTATGTTAADAAAAATAAKASLQGMSQAADPTVLPTLPADFNWKVYLLYHPDLASRGINNQAKAVEHWLQYGQYEGRVYNRLSVLMRYTACGGLTNQLYSHIAALTLAATLGAEVVLPPALTRSSFGHYFSMFKELNQVTWSAVPLDSLIDVDHYISYWKERGIMLHKTPPLLSFPDMATPEVAYMKYELPGINEQFVTQMTNIYQQRLLLSQLVERARAAVVGHAETLRRLDPTQPVNYVVLDLPCSFFMLAHLGEMELPKEAARSLRFPPAIMALADKVIDGIERGTGSHEFNGIHLRLESDSRDWSEILGGRDAFWQNYVNAIRTAGLTSSLPLYAATGLLSYGAEDEMTTTLRKLTENGWASAVVYKELYLAKEDQDGLSSEQKALVDFVVLTRAKTVVGLGSSTFSYYLREYRALNGFTKADTVLADASAIGTDDLFMECGMLSHGN